MTRILLLTMLLGTFACKQGLTQKSTAEVIGPDAFEQKVADLSAKEAEYQLLDIRTPEELEQTGTISGAVNLDFYNTDFKTRLDALDKDIPTFVFCRSGGRSGKCRSMLVDMGFREVYDLDGGMNGWKSAGKPSVAP